MPILNRGYSKHADWHINDSRTWTFGGFFNAALNRITVQVDIPKTCDSLTATITDWEFQRLPPSTTGDGFVDFIGFAWWDDRDHTNFEDTWFPNTVRNQFPDGTKREPEGIAFSEIDSITMTQNSGFYDLDTWFWVWQGNEGGSRWQSSNPIGMSHTWPLSENVDFDEHGQLKDRIVFCSYNRHLDWGDATSDHGHPCIPGSDPAHAHWLIDEKYWFSAGIWNWKYHPMAIRKGDDWYSCNRLNSDVGHGDGHLAIRKGGRWNAVWNDDYDVRTSEGYYDQVNGETPGPFVALPRVGLGSDAVRQQEDLHEWEE